ncbi:MAG: LysR family transcriptional regulator [Bdellovibrionota bacterium]
MSPQINYHHLYYFKVIATEGSIAKAAQKLKLGQPTLSSQLKQFEDSLDIKLFERFHKKLILTEAGRIALEYANEVFRLGSEMVEVLHDQIKPNKIHVQVGALDSVPKHIALELAKEAYRLGDCVVSILEGKGDELLRELLLHRIDLVLANYVPSVTEASGVLSRMIARLPISVCGASKYKELKKDFPSSLNGQPFILPTRHSKLRHDLEHYFQASRMQLNMIAETQDTAIQKLLGSEGIGLIAVPEVAALELTKRQELFELGKLQGISEEIYLIAASRKIENPISAKLMKAFRLG